MPITAQSNSNDCLPIVETLIDQCGKAVPQDFTYNPQNNVYFKDAHYGDSEMAMYMCTANSQKLVTRAMFFAGFSGMYDALNQSLGWTILFEEVNGVVKLPMEKEIVFLYKKHFVKFDCSDVYAQIIVSQ
jgi:hypothetical protein